MTSLEVAYHSRVPAFTRPNGWTDRMWQTFCDAGLAAVANLSDGPRWTHVAIHVPPPVPASLYSEIATASREILSAGLAEHMFFVHKPPGIRWRLRTSVAAYEADPDAERELDARVSAVTSGWRTEGYLTHRGIYEPQRFLFGGNQSMEHVHRTWTADSFLWLDWKASSYTLGGIRLSLTTLAHVFDCLGIVGWEDREVWSLIKEEAGRKLRPEALTREGASTLAKGIRWAWRKVWYEKSSILGERFSSADQVAEPFFADGGRAARDWYQACFAAGCEALAGTGPRRAAAYWTVFHWNRAGFPGGCQALLAEVLSRG